jgi:hypothetical protein
MATVRGGTKTENQAGEHEEQDHANDYEGDSNARKRFFFFAGFSVEPTGGFGRLCHELLHLIVGNNKVERIQQCRSIEDGGTSCESSITTALHIAITISGATVSDSIASCDTCINDGMS